MLSVLVVHLAVTVLLALLLLLVVLVQGAAALLRRPAVDAAPAGPVPRAQVAAGRVEAHAA